MTKIVRISIIMIRVKTVLSVMVKIGINHFIIYCEHLSVPASVSPSNRLNCKVPTRLATTICGKCLRLTRIKKASRRLRRNSYSERSCMVHISRNYNNSLRCKSS